MTILYLDRKTLTLEREGRAVVVRDGLQRLASVPLRLLDRVVIRANLTLDAALLHRLAQEGIPVMILGRRPNQVSLLLGAVGPDARRRLCQYRRYEDDNWRRHWAAYLVRRKLLMQKRLLIRHRRRRLDLHKPLSDAITRLERALNELDGKEPPPLDQLLGIEGAAARSYFQGYARLFPPALDFQGRNRRPPRDPVNATLSLGYTLLHGELVVACYERGLDPYIGFYHELSHGRESLASDLVEPLRPVVDDWVQALFRSELLRQHHFHTRGNACLLDKTGRSHFYKFWENRVRPLRRRIRRHMDQVVQVITQGEER